MCVRSIAGGLAIATVVSVAGVQVAHGQKAPAERQATAGMAASGQVLTEANGVLRLNSTPCRATQSVIVFRSPYGKEAAGDVNCQGGRRALVQVVQR